MSQATNGNSAGMVLPPEWKALLEASLSLEQDLRNESEKNQNLARQLTRIQFEKEILADQLEAAQRRLAELEAQPKRVEIVDPALQARMNQLLETVEARKAEASREQSERNQLMRLASAMKREVIYLQELYRIRGDVQDPTLQSKLVEFENLIERGYEEVSMALRPGERGTSAKSPTPPPFHPRRG